METSNIRITQKGEVHLVLPNQKPRNIGWFSDNGNTFHTQRNPAKHLHRNSNSYGFNYELLRDGNFSRVIVHLPFGGLLETTRIHILKKGGFLHFKVRGYERQRFLALSDFGREKAIQTENLLTPIQPKASQQNLFKEVA